MLNSLLIKNFALIRQLEMTPSPGFNIITGETGAGKSIMLGAIGLLLGNRADSKTLWQKEAKCVIEGSFNIADYQLQALFESHDWEYHPETIIRREININGKSRAFINDSPVNLESLRALGRNLLDIHSQHDTLQLGAQQFQLKVIDLYGQHQELLQTYQEHYDRWETVTNQKRELLEQSQEQQKEADYRKFLWEELSNAQLQAGEQQELEANLQVMEHAEEIKIQLNGSLQLLDQADANIQEQLAQSLRMLERISHFSKDYRALYDRLSSSYIEIQDIAGELNHLEQQVQFNPSEIEELKGRLDLIYRLQQKHQVQTVEELFQLGDDLESQQQAMDNLDQTLLALEKEIEEAFNKTLQDGKQLSNARKKAFQSFKEHMQALFPQLGMPDGLLEIDHKAAEPAKTGLDEVVWKFSASKGIPPKVLKEVASGGEFSRLMFCVKYILADKVALPTILFDEIDTGISGEIALQMVKMMQEMSENHQVITISHLPQFAAKGEHHYLVYKESSGKTATTNIKRLQGEDRVAAVAQMLGGNNPSEIAYANAKELLEPSN